MRLKNTSVKLKENRSLLEWLKYTEAYAWPRGKTLDRLTEVAPEKEVAIFLQGLKNVPSMKTIGHKLQLAQFEQWWRMDMTSHDLAKSLGILKISESMGTEKSILFFEYRLFLLKKALPSTP
ncbi:Avirulence protein [Phytophthora megakarya]|uniref:Avirulence protein n=1 Tax=Phytophthora megakarya TaxID=4795 RepID=A0A225UW61_9STRA|nr:Avirulence protein [Phytophthora megakarya]